MFCSNCGTNIPKGAKFCPVCGSPVKGGAAEASAQAQIPPVAGPSTQAQTPPVGVPNYVAGGMPYQERREPQPAPKSLVGSYPRGVLANIVGSALASVFMFLPWMNVGILGSYNAFGIGIMNAQYGSPVFLVIEIVVFVLVLVGAILLVMRKGPGRLVSVIGLVAAAVVTGLVVAGGTSSGFAGYITFTPYLFIFVSLATVFLAFTLKDPKNVA